MPNPTQVIGIIEIENTAELSMVLFGSLSVETSRRWWIRGASGSTEPVAADFESLHSDLVKEYGAFFERLAT